ncbi:mRNA-capping enzyme subunit alpha [Histoplasma capsulatum G186AR]|uniref:mRNA-capping enzyme subunit alpha n=1 Tax=Ajellomyces capsulatus TaxID=5037 RepID=A0A8H7Z7K0_AJECA|nr:mRNA-capping enzyme subunit alpha [Histoplasma capsulatum]QSS69819.1 mRNA-capping enzyme subunit alpha [Histoplasma capsulatum G186AR]
MTASSSPVAAPPIKSARMKTFSNGNHQERTQSIFACVYNSPSSSPTRPTPTVTAPRNPIQTTTPSPSSTSSSCEGQMTTYPTAPCTSRRRNGKRSKRCRSRWTTPLSSATRTSSTDGASCGCERIKRTQITSRLSRVLWRVLRIALGRRI